MNNSSIVPAQPQHLQETGIVPFSQPRSILELSPTQWEQLLTLADALEKTTLAVAKNGDKKMSKSDIIVIWAMGFELGFLPMQALSCINSINGKPSLDGKGMLALIYARGLMEEFKVESTATECKVTMKRKGQSPHSEIFTFKEAQDARLTSKPGAWSGYAKTMLKWRAVAACARIVFPDVLLGIETPDELGAAVDVDDEGAMTIVSSEPLPELDHEQVRHDLGTGSEGRRIPAPSQPATAPIAETATASKTPQTLNGSKIDAALLMKTALEKYQLGSKQVLIKLGVEDLRDFTGTFDEALALCNPFNAVTTPPAPSEIDFAVSSQPALLSTTAADMLRD